MGATRQAFLLGGEKVSTQRYIDTSFWDDTWIQELDPSEKLLYIYLLTNPVTNIAGIMELTIKRICFDTGFNADTVGHILKKFEDAGKVYQYKSYLIIRNFPKHQQLENYKILKGVVNILSKLPEDVLAYLEEIDYQLDIKKTFEAYSVPYNKEKKPLIEREPKNELEIIEKEYLLNYKELYEAHILNSEKPIINWLASRKLTNDAIEKYGFNLVLEAVKKSKDNEFCIEKGYSLTTILSAGVLAGLINSNGKKRKGVVDDGIRTEEIKF